MLDGVVLARSGEAFSDLVDIERIEVLRGPQGTLFGKNASAGVINIVSRRPSDTFGASVEGGFFFGNGQEYRVRGKVYMQRVTPKHGRPYVLMDHKGDGTFTKQDNTLDNGVRVPQWVLLEF